MKRRQTILRASCISSLILGLCAVYLFGSTELCRVDAGCYTINKEEYSMPDDIFKIHTEEIIIVDNNAYGWQTYSITRGDDDHHDKVIGLSDSHVDAVAPDLELEIGQVLEIQYDCWLLIAPSSFSHVFSLKFIRDATDDEFQAAQEYYNKYCQWMED